MKKIVFFEAHPDDLEFYCFHLIYYLSMMSKKEYKIKIGSLTRGEYGWPKHAEHFKGERLGRLRTKELYKAMSIYGIPPKDIHFFGIIDGYVQFDSQTIELLKKYLEKERPDIIFACEPRNTYYRHPDHMNVGKVVYYILDKALIEDYHPILYFYGSIGANFCWPFKKEEISLAVKTMHIHKSQMHIWKGIGRLYKLIIRNYGRHVKGWKFAEGFRRAYYGKKTYKNKRLNLLEKIFLFL
ncbi:MAG: PIG-L family deacetylase, partial [Promethearchaeota archaeon]